MLRRYGVPADPPIHLVPASTQYVEAVRLGFGWGMVPDLQRQDWTVDDGVVLSPGHAEDVTLYWQQWSLRTPSLDRVAEAIRAASTEILRPIG